MKTHSFMDSVEIGHLKTYDIKLWNKIKSEYPQLYDKLDDAVVKDLDDKVVVEDIRFNNIIASLQK